MSRAALRLRATSFAAVALVVLAGCASRPVPSKPSHVAGTGRAAVTTHSAITTTHAFAAFDPSGSPSAGVAAHRSGSCWTSSITVSARNAYRCLAGKAASDILDPCFASSRSHPQTVYCYADPWSGAVALNLHGSHLPKPGAPLKIAQPWAIALTGGIRCVVTTGAAPLLHGVPMRYACPSATAGVGNSGGTVLHAWYQPTGGTPRVVAVTDTWAA